MGNVQSYLQHVDNIIIKNNPTKQEQSTLIVTQDK